MTKIDRTKIVKAAVGSARLEGYKGSLKTVISHKTKPSEAHNKRPATAKR